MLFFSSKVYICNSGDSTSKVGWLDPMELNLSLQVPGLWTQEQVQLTDENINWVVLWSNFENPTRIIKKCLNNPIDWKSISSLFSHCQIRPNP